MTTTAEPPVPEVDARVIITVGRWGTRTGRLVSLSDSEAVVQLAEGRVTVGASMVRAMSR